MRFRAFKGFVLLSLAGFMVSLVLMTMPGLAAELDDSQLFVDAFNAFRKNDYLLTIEKIDQLFQIFPDSRLRDVSLLLVARAALKSGDNELAAKTINKFNDEFGDSPFKSAIEEELLTLGIRRSKGEKLLPNEQLMAAALKTRKDRIEMETAALLKTGQNPPAEAKPAK